MDFINNENALVSLTAEDIMISSEKVAHVQLSNPLEHALLILLQSGYSAVPVLDSKYRFKGIIDKGAIINKTLGLDRFEMENLSTFIVEDAMETNIPCLSRTANLFECMKILTDHSFICINDKDGFFDGIVTRRAILKHVNTYFDQYNDMYNIVRQ